MLTTNPFSELYTLVPPPAMQSYVIVMLLLVVAGTVVDVMHKKSAKYFFQAGVKSREARTREVGGGEKASIALKTAAYDVLASGEFCNQRRRIAHLLTMYGFVLFLISTFVMVFTAADAVTSAIWPLLWYLGALMVAGGGYWFWFNIRVDVAAEGNPWYRVSRADLFVLSLLGSTTFAILWGAVQAGAGVGFWSMLFFALFIIASTVLFGSVPWSKFAHMFFKPAAAYQRHLGEADGSRQNLPPPADKPEQFGLGIKREAPRHY
ncbi:adenylyl-sulfate reductase [Thiohalomonas denitrificans]|uniref:Adenylyl-sulfate reductase n=1 Tax=Thiohalomonas denitrificans TaxID=415747 RepID=A0A1G5QE39_9GAMM|nr:adenylyl-sulfate reductase [Thiohalomonas denitrificans]SCZ60133.1 hypothetical protein SAMN03097708_01991 [Thiohalomonas denitrificans]